MKEVEMRDDLLEWEHIEGVVHGLIEKSGWNEVGDEGGVFSAERDVNAGDDHSVTFVVAENKEALLFMVRLEVRMTARPSADRMSAIVDALASLIAGHALILQSASLENESPVFEFIYGWKCDSDLKLSITLPVLCETVQRWMWQFTAPVMAIAPHASRFLLGSSSVDELLNEARHDLELLSVASVGTA